MRYFNYSAIREQKWDSEVLGLIAAIYKEAGKQELYLKQRPDDLEKLEFKKGIRLYIEIQCDTGNQSYKVTDVYKLFTDDILLEENAAALQTELGNIKGNSAFNPDSNAILTNEMWTWRHESRK